MADFGKAENIKPEFEALISPLAPEEYRLLTESMLKYGQREPILTWHGFIIDGHHRKKIASEHTDKITQLKYEEYAPLINASDTEVKIWMIKNQLGRRNLTLDQKVMRYAGELIKLESEAADERKKAGVKIDHELDVAQGHRAPETRDIVASVFGVGHSKIDECKHVTEDAPALIPDVLSGKTPLHTAANIAKRVKDIKDPEEKALKVQEYSTPAGKAQLRKDNKEAKEARDADSARRRQAGIDNAEVSEIKDKKQVRLEAPEVEKTEAEQEKDDALDDQINAFITIMIQDGYDIRDLEFRFNKIIRAEIIDQQKAEAIPKLNDDGSS